MWTYALYSDKGTTDYSLYNYTSAIISGVPFSVLCPKSIYYAYALGLLLLYITRIMTVIPKLQRPFI